MGRRFLPSLRSIETKAFSLGNSNANWGIPVQRVATGSSVFGHVDRAADWDMDAVIAEGYERSVWVYRCIELISSSQSRLPFRIGRDIGGDDQQVLEEHPLYRVLNKRANPLETGRQFRKRLSAQVLLSKRGAFIEVTRSAAGIITRLDLLDPSRVIPIPSNSGQYIDYFQYTRLDGKVREIPPSRIRWVREPHPTDPFSGTTPLEAAGISVELDQLARVYNVAFLKNDARPGGVLAVDTDTLTEQEAARLERRFKPGAYGAGELAVIASGPKGINYVDTTTRPRDMAYADLAKTTKEEILAAFGIGESMLGNAAGRTFDNAEQEKYNFWTEPMPPHLELIAGAFADDIGDVWEPYFDTASVEALEAGKRRKREEARGEFEKGLRSIDEYRPLANLPRVNNPQSRALWVSPAKAPIPTDPRDAAALLGAEGGGPGGAPMGDQPAPPTDGGGGEPQPTGQPGGGATAADIVSAARDLDATAEATEPDAGAAAAAVAAARAENIDQVVPSQAAFIVEDARGEDETPEAGPAAQAVLAARLEKKSAAVQPIAVDHEIPDALYAQAEAALTGALQAMLARQRGVLEARLAAPGSRKGTRFWRPDYEVDTRAGQDPIDMDKVVDSQRWEDELAQTLSPLVQSASADAAEDLIAALLVARLLVMPAEDKDRLEQVAGMLTAAVSLGTISRATDALKGWLGDVRFMLDVEQHAADDITDLTGALNRHYADRADSFARSLGGDLAHQAINGAADAAAGALESTDKRRGIVRTWVSKRDERVRPTHSITDGTTLPVGERFSVGAGLLLHPHDPSGPLEEIINCRCRLRYRAAADARFILHDPTYGDYALSA